ncbi:MAG: sulfite oxidase [Rhodobacterales bacterium]|nr:sulfite oxidase [Rhodobacterales bacterium]MDX5412371.1 sulfite oxidase [Rhodobacterales bacterium]
MNTMLTLKRRQFLVSATGTAMLGVSGATVSATSASAQDQSTNLPGYADWKRPGAMIRHSELTLETERAAIGTGVVTPNDVFFVRNNLTPPEAAATAGDDWEVQIEGVAEPATRTLGELKRMGMDSVATIIQCSGNGRGFHDHEASGSPWLTGAAGCAVWTGVPVRDIVEAHGGVSDGAQFMTSTGGEDLPEDVDRDEVVVERSVPLKEMENAILAYEMNGEPIPLAHGGPVRMIVPGYYGVNNVKYVDRLAFTPEESKANIMTSGYRVRPVGESGAPDQPTMWDMKVKSWIIHPLKDSETGQVHIYGVAFGGTNPVEKVEVSTDGGSNWQEARLIGPDLGRYAWRTFVLAADLEAGQHTLASRATDSEGNVQESTTEPNHRAYDYAGWDRLAVDVTIA